MWRVDNNDENEEYFYLNSCEILKCYSKPVLDCKTENRICKISGTTIIRKSALHVARHLNEAIMH